MTPLEQTLIELEEANAVLREANTLLKDTLVSIRDAADYIASLDAPSLADLRPLLNQMSSLASATLDITTPAEEANHG